MISLNIATKGKAKGISRVFVISAIVIVTVTISAAFFLVQPTHQTRISNQDAPLVTGHVHFLHVDKDNENVMLLGTHEGLYRTEDGGKAWASVEVKGDVKSRDFMAIAPDTSQSSKVLYAAGHGMYVIKSIDDGKTWTLVNKGLPHDDVHAITIASNDPNTIYAWVVGYGLFRSNNGGESWQRVDDGPPNADLVALASVNVPTGMGGIYLYAGTTNGLFRSPDCFCGWTKVTKFFDSATIYALTVHPYDPKIIFASIRDGIYRSEDGGATWERFSRGLGKDPIGALAFSADAKVVYAVEVTGMVYKSTDLDSWVRVK